MSHMNTGPTGRTGIPTRYRGRQYRSRLEARWAAFFDLLGWQFEYEPFDLPRWIPDFVLIGAKANALVEVKPICALDKAITAEIERALPPNQEALLVGASLYVGLTYADDFESLVPSSNPYLGWLFETIDGGWHLTDFVSAEEAPDRIEWEKGRRLCDYFPSIFRIISAGPVRRAPADKIDRLWAEAGNLVQWRGRS